MPESSLFDAGKQEEGWQQRASAHELLQPAPKQTARTASKSGAGYTCTVTRVSPISKG